MTADRGGTAAICDLTPTDWEDPGIRGTAGALDGFVVGGGNGDDTIDEGSVDGSEQLAGGVPSPL